MGLKKRGLGGTAITVIVVFVVLIAAILVYNFVIKEKVAPPDPVAVQCALICDTNQTSAFCSFKVNASETIRVTCNELATNSQYAQYNVQLCPGISCSVQQPIQDQTCTGLGGTWEQPASTGRCTQSGTKVRRTLTTTDSPPQTGEICCK